MFREMRRIKQQITREECVEILKAQPRGVLSVSGDDGYPYGVPLDHYYDPESGKIYFHCAKTGHKIDAIRRNDKVSYCVCDEGYRKDGEWALNIKSVIVFGRIREIDEPECLEKICRKIAGKFTSDSGYIDEEIRKHLARVKCLELTPEHITGKLVNES